MGCGVWGEHACLPRYKLLFGKPRATKLKVPAYHYLAAHFDQRISNADDGPIQANQIGGQVDKVRIVAIDQFDEILGDKKDDGSRLRQCFHIP